MGLNKVFLIGNLTRDPELKYTQTGTAVTRFGVAVNKRYTASSGEKREETCFVDVVAWGRTAEICSEYLAKGRQVLVEGELRMNSWETDSGEKRTKHEVNAQNVQFLGGRGGSQGGAPSSEPRSEEASMAKPEEPEPAAEEEEEEEGLGDDEIPF